MCLLYCESSTALYTMVQGEIVIPYLSHITSDSTPSAAIYCRYSTDKHTLIHSITPYQHFPIFGISCFFYMVLYIFLVLHTFAIYFCILFLILHFPNSAALLDPRSSVGKIQFSVGEISSKYFLSCTSFHRFPVRLSVSFWNPLSNSTCPKTWLRAIQTYSTFWTNFKPVDS